MPVSNEYSLDHRTFTDAHANYEHDQLDKNGDLGEIKDEE